MINSSNIISKQSGKFRKNINNLSLVVLSLFLIFFLNACATTSDLDNLRTEVRNAKIASLHQQKDISALKSRVSELSNDISALKETAVKEPAFGAIKENQGSILDQISKLHTEVQSLKGRLDEGRHISDKSMKELLSERELQNAKIAAIEKELQEVKKKIGVMSEEKKDTPQDQKPIKEGAIPSQPKTSEKTELNDPQKIFEAAQADFKEKRYTEARLGYEKLAKDFPKHHHAPLSQFGIAETYYSEKKYEDAILAYETFIKKYPTNDKVRMSMLKQGYSFFELGDKKTGKVILEKLIEKYPRSNETEQAKKKLSEVLSRKKR